MKIETNPSVADFFRNTVKTILKSRNLQIGETTEFYVVNLLTQAVRAYTERKEPKFMEEPLAILFGRAFSTYNPNEQFSLLKQLGDQSLLISGFFGDSLKRKLVDVDYYISMGSTAYSHLSDISKRNETRDVFASTFDEMALKFMIFVDLFSEISEQANLTNNQDLLRLYERWLFTKSRRLLAKLQEMGIDPQDVTKDIH